MASQEPERKEAEHGLEQDEERVNGLEAELERHEARYLQRLVRLNVGDRDPDDGHDEDAEWHFDDEREQPEACELRYLQRTKRSMSWRLFDLQNSREPAAYSLAQIPDIGQIEANDLENDHQNEGKQDQDDPDSIGRIRSGDLEDQLSVEIQAEVVC